VKDDKLIEFDGHPTSLSSSALEILRTRYGYRGRSVAGTLYWCHEGKTLSELRLALEN